MKNWKARASPPPDATQCRNDVVDHVLQQGHRHSFKFNHSEEYRGKNLKIGLRVNTVTLYKPLKQRRGTRTVINVTSFKSHNRRDHVREGTCLGRGFCPGDVCPITK